MVYSIVLGDGNRGWTHLAFERAEDADLQSCAVQFEKDVSGVADMIRQKVRDPLFGKVSVDLLVETLAVGGYKLINSVALLAQTPGNTVAMMCKGA